MKFLQHTITGIQLGSIYALIALGYSMVYGIIQLINFAHGDLIMVGAYCALTLIASQFMPMWAAILVTIVICMVFGMLIEKLAYTPLRGAARISLLITAIGVSLFLQNAAQLIFSPNPRMFQDMFPGKVSVFGIDLKYTTIVTVLVSAAIMVALSLVIKYTKMGKAMRAVSEDTQTAKLMGINVNSTISFTFAIGSGLAAVASLMYASSYSQIHPTIGNMIGLKAFVAAVLGGIGSIPGAMLGGFLIGLAETFTRAYLSSSWADAIVFGILILVLLIKPEGIFGKNMREKV